MDESQNDESKSERLHLLAYAVEDALDAAVAAFPGFNSGDIMPPGEHDDMPSAVSESLKHATYAAPG